MDSLEHNYYMVQFQLLKVSSFLLLSPCTHNPEHHVTHNNILLFKKIPKVCP